MWLSPFAFSNKSAIASGYGVFARYGVCIMAALITVHIVYMWWNGNGYRGPYYLIKRWWNDEPRPQRGENMSMLAAISRTLSFFSKDAETTHLEQRIREIDPSQHEFEKTFKDIIGGYQTKERRIIIVFDNVDRLPNDGIQDAWANIRAIVSADRASDGTERKVTLIIPYDRQHILTAITTDLTAITTDADKKVQEDLLRKSFDAILFVAAPVISDASAFFALKLLEALDDQIDKEVGYRAYKIFDISCQGSLSTPRQIIAFINAVTGLWEQWEGRIPIPTIALFMANREKLSVDPTSLRRPDEIDERQRDLADDPDLFKHLAALAYNVDPDLALQVLLDGRIELLFTGITPEDEVNAIMDSPGWDTILPDVYRDKAKIWASTSATQFRNAVRNLSNLNASPSNRLESKRALLGALGELVAVSPASWSEQEDLLRLYELCDRSEGRQWTLALAAWLQRSLPKREERGFSHGRDWISFVGKMHKVLVTEYGEDEALELISNIEFPESDEFLIGVAFDADLTGLRLANFKNRPKTKDLNGALDSRLIENPEEFYYAWPELRALLGKGQAATFAGALSAHLQETKVEDIDDLIIMLKSYNKLITDSTMTSALTTARQDLVSDGALYHHIEAIRNSKNDRVDEGLAAAFWLILGETEGKAPEVTNLQAHAFGDLNAQRDWVNKAIRDAEIGDGSVSKLSELIRDGDTLEAWIDWAAAAPRETRLVQNAILKVIQRNDFAPPPPSALATHYEFLKELLGEDMEALRARTGIVRKTEEWTSLAPPDLPLSLIADNAKRQEQGWQAMYTTIDKWLVDQDADTLTQSLLDETRLVDVLRQRVIDAKLTLPPDKIKTAIKDHVLGMLSGERPSRKDFDSVWRAVPVNSRAGLAKDVLDLLDNTVVTSAGIDVALTCYSELLAQLPLTKRSDVAARKIILPSVEAALNGSATALDFLKDNERQMRQVLKGVEEPSIIGELCDHLESRTSSDEDEESDSVRQRIREILALSCSQSENSEGDQPEQ